jgi:hypothetical protein
MQAGAWIVSQRLRAGDSATALRCRLTSRSDVKAAQAAGRNQGFSHTA